MALKAALCSLGMTTAFDQPRGSANFDRMAPRRPDAYLGLSDVFHQTWLSLDEDGTEAAAASTVALMTFAATARKPIPPLEVRVDHPFLFAIQHVASGTCLFLGKVSDPR
jgi:serpin B